MAEQPLNRLDLLRRWSDAKKRVEETAKPILAEERALRDQVVAAYFPDPKEGTNKEKLPMGWTLKDVHEIDRKVDPAPLKAVSAKLREMGANPDDLVEWKPNLRTKAYRELTAEQRKVFDETLTIKPGSPTIELIPPKEK